jgi:hypothetical protein
MPQGISAAVLAKLHDLADTHGTASLLCMTALLLRKCRTHMLGALLQAGSPWLQMMTVHVAACTFQAGVYQPGAGVGILHFADALTDPDRQQHQRQ